jgi:excisionase family DNA binding protein
MNEKIADFEIFGNPGLRSTGWRLPMRFMTTGRVAAAFQVTIPTVKRWIREGHLKAFQTAGGHYRITEQELEHFRAARNFPVIPAVSEELPRVLVVDDDPRLLSMLSDAFTHGGRYTIEVARDGYEGLIKVGSFRPHVLILDVRMPGLDGFQVCRRVKADPGRGATRILVMTGHVQGDTEAHAIAAGADAFLAKPVPMARLHAEVDRLIAGHHATAGAVVTTT